MAFQARVLLADQKSSQIISVSIVAVFSVFFYVANSRQKQGLILIENTVSQTRYIPAYELTGSTLGGISVYSLERKCWNLLTVHEIGVIKPEDSGTQSRDSRRRHTEVDGFWERCVSACKAAAKAWLLSNPTACHYPDIPS